MFPLYKVCEEFLSQTDVELCYMFFSASIEMIMWFLSFIFLMQCITLIDLQILNHPCIPGINPTWSCCTILFMYCWIWFANILLRIFCIYAHQECWLLTFFFLNSVFVWFWNQGNAGLIEWVWECSSLCNILEEFEKDRC